MGGYGAMNIALRHPNEFSQIVSVAGYFRVDAPAGVLARNHALIAANNPVSHASNARGKRILLAEDTSDDLPAIKGEAARFKAVLDRAHIPATLWISPGQHDWSYAARALAGAISFLSDGWDRAS